jgi:hypothetical protein
MMILSIAVFSGVSRFASGGSIVAPFSIISSALVRDCLVVPDPSIGVFCIGSIIGTIYI